MQFWLFSFKTIDMHLQRINVKGSEFCMQHNNVRAHTGKYSSDITASHFWERMRQMWTKFANVHETANSNSLGGNPILSDEYNSKCSRCYSTPFYHGHAVFPRRSWWGRSF